MFRTRKTAPSFSVEISQHALDSIFDDCDKYDVDETGGRLLGTYKKDGATYKVCVTGLLPAGPNAERSATFFLQDGNYQEQLFRAIEETHPDVEHIGNWHTHHVNGLRTLSGGDKQLYNKIVNHPKHNTDFFYALLVTQRNSGRGSRYEVKHFFFRRADSSIYEALHADVIITGMPLLTPVAHQLAPGTAILQTTQPNLERAKDAHFFSEFYPEIKPLLSRTTGSPYWKGSFSLIDDSLTNVVAMEETEGNELSYAIAVSCQNMATVDVPAMFKDRRFPSARLGVVSLEKELNRAIFKGKRS